MCTFGLYMLQNLHSAYVEFIALHTLYFEAGNDMRLRPLHCHFSRCDRGIPATRCN